jgi:hypothetical protein
MKKIGDLVERFKNFVPPEKILKEIIIDAIKDVAGVNLSLKEIEINHSNARLKTSSIKKSQILIKKEKVLEALSIKLGKKSPRDII